MKIIKIKEDITSKIAESIKKAIILDKNLFTLVKEKYANLNINLKGKFTTERGRINCSLREKNGFYRWLGVQFVVKEK